jgi:hypothetical protein
VLSPRQRITDEPVASRCTRLASNLDLSEGEGGDVFITRNRLMALGAVLLGACSAGPRNRLAAAPDSDFSLSVTNNNWLDVTVFAVRGSSRWRLGDVTGNSTALLRIPGRMIVAGMVQLLADPIGSDEIYLTGPISVSPDEDVQLTVAPRMRMSSYAVRAR